MDTRPMIATLEALAEQAVPARIPADLWQRGRRRRRLTRIRAALACVAAVTLVAVGIAAVPGLTRTATRPAHPAAPPSAEARVPSRIHMPYPWQQSAHLSPPGPASVVMGFDTESGGRFNAFEIAVVGVNGAYRLLQAGHRPLLSPDGRHVAYVPRGSDTSGVVLVDLTGDRTAGQYYPEPGRLWTPAAWAPDGRRLAVFESDTFGNDALLLMDPATGDTRELVRSGPYRSPVVFSPDGKRLAVQTDRVLSIVDIETGQASSLPTTLRLAGPGAWSPDGTRLAAVHYDGCAKDCTSAQINARKWQIRYINPQTGADQPATGLPALTDFAVEVLGWTNSGRLVAVSHTARDFGAMPLDREFISQDGQVDAQDGNVMRTRVLDWASGDPLAELAGEIRYVDMPRDLIVNDRFGGPSPKPSFWPFTGIWLTGFIGMMIIAVLVTAAAIALFVIIRLRRRETAPSHS